MVFEDRTPACREKTHFLVKIQIPESMQRFQEKLLLEQLLFFGRRRRDSGSMTVTKTQRLRRNETKHSGQLKCTEGSQCGSSHPYRVLSLCRSNHHDLHRERSRRRLFLVIAEVNVALHMERNAVDFAGSFNGEFWLEQNFRETDTFGATVLVLPLGRN